MKEQNVRIMVEGALAVALAWVLGQFAIRWLAFGGSVSLQMVPIFFVALRHGARAGILAGAILGIVKLVLSPYILHPVQLIMDYPLPFAVLGAAGFFRQQPMLGIAVGAGGRLLAHVLAGVWFWASYAPEGANVWVYSISYNASYLVPETIISMIVIYWLRTRRDLFDVT